MLTNTQGREEAIQIIQDPERNGRNAMQTMLMQKQTHGSGDDLSFPDATQIEDAMKDHEPNRMAPIYGDGNHTTPTKLWAALGGYGVLIPTWNRNAELIEARGEINYSGGAIGQTGSTTRQELIAWLLVFSLPIRSMHVADSASMLSKAKKLIEAVAQREAWIAQGEESPTA